MNLYRVNRLLDEVRQFAEELVTGKTIEDSKIRVKRLATSIKVTDLTNAGKRGKKVDSFSLYMLDRIDTPQLQGVIDQFEKVLERFPKYSVAVAWAKKVRDAADNLGDFIGYQELQTKGVNVDPPGFKPVKFSNRYISVKADRNGFSVSDLTDKANEQTMTKPVKGGKMAAKRFLVWLARNERKARGMNFSQFRQMFKKEGIGHHYYLGMD